jgi:hypothetical protein
VRQPTVGVVSRTAQVEVGRRCAGVEPQRAQRRLAAPLPSPGQRHDAVDGRGSRGQDLGMAGDGGPGRRRVFVEDARRNGQFLRVTWHGDRQQFVVSNWEDTVCVGATRVDVAEVPELIGVLVEGLADAPSRPPVEPPAPQTLLEHLQAWWRDRGRRALVVPLRARAEDRQRRSA